MNKPKKASARLYILRALILGILLASASGVAYAEATRPADDAEKGIIAQNEGDVGAEGMAPALSPASLEYRMGAVNADRVNVRERGDIASGVIGMVTRGERLKLYKWQGEWFEFEYNGRRAYISGQYVAVEPDAASQPTNTPAPTPRPTLPPPEFERGRVNITSGSLRLRESPDINSAVLADMPPNAELKIIDKLDEWYKVIYSATTGYAAKRYIACDGTPPAPTSKPTAKPAQKGVVALQDAGSKLIIRSEPKKSASIVDRLKKCRRS